LDRDASAVPLALDSSLYTYPRRRFALTWATLSSRRWRLVHSTMTLYARLPIFGGLNGVILSKFEAGFSHYLNIPRKSLSFNMIPYSRQSSFAIRIRPKRHENPSYDCLVDL